jgi:chromosome segregation ATPase
MNNNFEAQEIKEIYYYQNLIEKLNQQILSKKQIDYYGAKAVEIIQEFKSNKDQIKTLLDSKNKENYELREVIKQKETEKIDLKNKNKSEINKLNITIKNNDSEIQSLNDQCKLKEKEIQRLNNDLITMNNKVNELEKKLRRKQTKLTI